MLTVDQMAAAFTGTRSEFSALFVQSQAVRGAGAPLRFEVIARASDDRAAYAAAFQEADDHGFQAALLIGIARAGLATSSLLADLLESWANEPRSASHRAELHRIVDQTRNLAHPEQVRSGIARGIQLTAKILIDGSPAGTGLLIGPHLLLTAWHVVAPLFENLSPDALSADDGQVNRHWHPRPGSAARLTVEFDDFLVSPDGDPLRRPASRRPISVPDTWCVGFGRCHPDEQANRWPEDPWNLKDYWDYVVLQMNEAPGNERGWHSWDDCVPSVRPGERLWLFQHPGGLPMRLDDSRAWKYDPHLDPLALDMEPLNNPLLIPGMRFLHEFNAIGGSSGGPCFNDEFKLFGIHQGAFPDLGSDRSLNRGIPVYSIVQDYRTRYPGGLPSPAPHQCQIWHLSERDFNWPILGCDDFQALIWRAALGGKTRIITLNGSRGSGKSFRIKVMDAMLPAATHLKLILSAQTLANDDALTLSRRLCERAGASSDFPSLAASENTVNGWIQNNLLPALLRNLNQARNDRQVWIAITDLDQHEIKGANASDLLFALYQEALRTPWLRIILDGPLVDLPPMLRSATEVINVAEITRNDIRGLARRFLAELKRPVQGQDLALEVHLRRLHNGYLKSLRTEREKAVEILSLNVFEFINDFVEEFRALTGK